MINKKIKNYMEERGIKQSFLKEPLGMTASTLNALLNGNRKLSAEEYFKICDALGVPLEYFRKESDWMRYRIEYADGKCCSFANGSEDLIDWLKLLKDETICDIRKIYKNGVTDSVIEKYQKYIKH